MSKDETPDLARQYDVLWADAAPAVARGEAELDAWVARKDQDPRRGLTLLARPGPGVAHQLDVFLDELRDLEPGQYAQPVADMHLTILSLLGGTPDHAAHLAHLPAYQAAADEALQGAPPFEVEVTGVTLSRAAVLAQGFPMDDTLEQMRERLRAALVARGLDSGLDRRYRLRTAHLTLLRFAAPLRHPERFVKTVEAARGRPFGVMRVRELELVVGDWYQSADRTRLVQRYRLTPVP